MIDRGLLHAYCDGELTGAEQAEVEANLKHDPQAVAEMQAIRRTKQLLSTNAKPMAEEAVWRKCVGRLDAIDKTKRVEGFVSRYAWGLCALFLFVILGGGVLRKMNPNSVRTGQVASYVSSLGGSWSKPPVQASDRREWINEHLGAVSDAIRPDMLRVLGGMEGFEDGHRVTCVRLADERGKLDLVVVSNVDSIEGMDSGQVQVGTVNEANYVAWHLNNCALYLLGDSTQRSQDELTQIASNIRLR